MCNTAKGGLMNVRGGDSGTTRSGEGGGFKEFDPEEDARRKKRKMEEAAERDERKALKKKCSYCHRAACIC